jgi:hypothetical protein
LLHVSCHGFISALMASPLCLPTFCASGVACARLPVGQYALFPPLGLDCLPYRHATHVLTRVSEQAR